MFAASRIISCAITQEYSSNGQFSDFSTIKSIHQHKMDVTSDIPQPSMYKISGSECHDVKSSIVFTISRHNFTYTPDNGRVRLMMIIAGQVFSFVILHRLVSLIKFKTSSSPSPFIIIIVHIWCPVVVRRPQYAASTSAYLALSSARWYPSSSRLVRLSNVSPVFLWVFSFRIARVHSINRHWKYVHFHIFCISKETGECLRI